MKKTVKFLLIPLTVMMLTACGSGADTSELDKSSVEIGKDGTVTSTLIDDFAESYYDIKELENMAGEEIDSYNLTKGEGSAELVSVDKKNEKVKVVTKFKDADTFADFNGETFMYKTVEEAKGVGQVISGGLIDADGITATSDQISSLSKEHVVITSSKTVVAAPYKIKYVSQGASLIGSYMADLSQTDPESVVYIVLSK